MLHPTTEFRLPIDQPEPMNEIFTNSELQELRKDIRNTLLPSWLEKPPSNIGDRAHGKLKADHWRTLCSVSMVITLVRLWGTSSVSSEQARALDNFMHLVAAVDLATRRSMCPDRANAFDVHMEAYVTGLRSIYNENIVPNHHLSLHLKECLLLFGPTHGWWAFPFERFNGLVQRLKTNHKPCTSCFVACYTISYSRSRSGDAGDVHPVFLHRCNVTVASGVVHVARLPGV